MDAIPPITLDYRSSPANASKWPSVFRFLLIGPCTGVALSFATTSVAVIVWVLHGEPDFYFRGWSGVEVSYVFGSILGAILGLPVAVILQWFEHVSGRRLRLLISIPILLLLKLIAAVPITWIEFQRRQLFAWGLWYLTAEVILWCVVSIAASRPQAKSDVSGAAGNVQI